MNEKYEFTGETKNIGFSILKRIRAIKDFGGVKAGELGGWIEKEENLSTTDEAWVHNEACVSENAVVKDKAQLYDKVWAHGEAQIYDNALMTDDAEAEGEAQICGNAFAKDGVLITGSAIITDNTCISEDARITGYAKISGSAKIEDCVKIEGYAQVGGSAHIYGNVRVFEYAVISGEEIELNGNLSIGNRAEILSMSHVFGAGPLSSRNDIATFYRTKNNKIHVRCGYYNGPFSKFGDKMTSHYKGEDLEIYLMAAELAQRQINLKIKKENTYAGTKKSAGKPAGSIRKSNHVAPDSGGVFKGKDG